jgi:hypothetical protein
LEVFDEGEGLWSWSSDSEWLSVSWTTATRVDWGDSDYYYHYDMTVHIAANPSWHRRIGTVELRWGDYVEVYVVRQMGGATRAVLTPDELTADAQAQSFDVVADCYPDCLFSADQPWVSLSQTEGTGPLTVEVEANYTAQPRIAILRADSPAATWADVYIRQAAGPPGPVVPALTLSRSTASPDSVGATFQAIVTSYSAWEATSSAEWVTVTATGNGGLLLRQATVTVRTTTTPPVEATIDVVQSPGWNVWRTVLARLRLLLATLRVW